jgi:hypothetical protein
VQSGRTKPTRRSRRQGASPPSPLTPPPQQSHAERYAFLVDVRDENGLKPGGKRVAPLTRAGDAGYDPSTLFIPPEAFSKFTAFETQYWSIKK